MQVKKMADEITIIIAEKGYVPSIGDLAHEEGDDDLYRITEHLGLVHDRGAAIRPGSGAPNYWRFTAVPTGGYTYDMSEDEYNDAHTCEIMEED
jgi:hypothetical protein